MCRVLMPLYLMSLSSDLSISCVSYLYRVCVEYVSLCLCISCVCPQSSVSHEVLIRLKGRICVCAHTSKEEGRCWHTSKEEYVSSCLCISCGPHTSKGENMCVLSYLLIPLESVCRICGVSSCLCVSCLCISCISYL
jgi:hypothetical protein